MRYYVSGIDHYFIISQPTYWKTDFPLVSKCGRQESMADNISQVSSKCLFEVWLFNMGVTNDKIALIAMYWRIFRKLEFHF